MFRRSLLQALFLTFALGALIPLASCEKAPQDKFRLGLAAALTGADGTFGSTMIQGAQLAVEEWNARGGVLGKQIVSVARDDEGKPEKAVTVAQELASQGVGAVVGHFNSGCSIPASSIYSQYGIVQITPSSTNPELTNRGLETVFRNVGRDDQQGAIAGLFMRQKLGMKKIAVLHDKLAFGEGIAREVKRSFEGVGGEVIVFDGMSSTELDFRANIAAIKASGAEGIFWGGMYSQAGPLFNQLRQAGLEIPFVAADGSYSQPLIDTVGANPSKLYLTYGPDYTKLAAAQPFLAKYHQRYGQEGAYSVYAYDAVNILLTAITDAQTTDAKAVAQKLRTRAFETCLGTVEFDSRGDLKKANFIPWTVRDGRFVPFE